MRRGPASFWSPRVSAFYEALGQTYSCPKVSALRTNIAHYLKPCTATIFIETFRSR